MANEDDDEDEDKHIWLRVAITHHTIPGPPQLHWLCKRQEEQHQYPRVPGCPLTLYFLPHAICFSDTCRSNGLRVVSAVFAPAKHRSNQEMSCSSHICLPLCINLSRPSEQRGAMIALSQADIAVASKGGDAMQSGGCASIGGERSRPLRIGDSSDERRMI
ncbi:hypothetical protein EYF80_019772 [Liparis tanakae]|uniref:Uncharacterized protein n=1 Tax=Liparis tanakae TaxID=230148 RepID=A0A4Z2HW67_9TELE|nr:hypothetical protein EYF80_019772 [Liparis tanakae]